MAEHLLVRIIRVGAHSRHENPMPGTLPRNARPGAEVNGLTSDLARCGRPGHAATEEDHRLIPCLGSHNGEVACQFAGTVGQTQSMFSGPRRSHGRCNEPVHLFRLVVRHPDDQQCLGQPPCLPPVEAPSLGPTELRSTGISVARRDTRTTQPGGLARPRGHAPNAARCVRGCLAPFRFPVVLPTRRRLPSMGSVILGEVHRRQHSAEYGKAGQDDPRNLPRRLDWRSRRWNRIRMPACRTCIDLARLLVVVLQLGAATSASVPYHQGLPSSVSGLKREPGSMDINVGTDCTPRPVRGKQARPAHCPPSCRNGQAR